MTVADLSDVDPVRLITDRPARTDAYRCTSCRAVQRHPSPLPTFGVKCDNCGATISSRDVFIYADLRRRLFALFLDVAAFGLPTASLDLVIGGWAIDYAPKNIYGHPTHTAVIWIKSALASVTAISLLGYLLRGNARGRTVGKMATGLRVVRAADGARPSLAASVVRTLAQLLMIPTVGVEYMLSSLDPQRRTLHDRIAGTIVIER